MDSSCSFYDMSPLGDSPDLHLESASRSAGFAFRRNA